MGVHVAILQRPYLRLVLDGRKTVESRLSKSAVSPYGQVRRGDRIYLKASGGPFMAAARAGWVESHQDLTPRQVDRLRQRLNALVCGDAAYWKMKREARYATFIELRDVRPIDEGPPFKPSRYRAWFVLPEDADAALHAQGDHRAIELPLTAGAVRNRYVSVNGQADFFPHGEFTLELPDGETVRTSLYRGQRIRWRGWGVYFAAHRLDAGDAVRFVASGRGRYRVLLIRRQG